MQEKASTHPMELRNRVTSPGGTTIHGLAEWEKNAVNSGIIESVYQAYLRSKDLS
jgi:pyrroline-5-carboxylate reductase